ncbi:protein FAM241B-like [Babylonia areolata]|uniref:protein FAM241B-like n=1 Tax=Babylonia areolata TaxID=304850 RepID=UPI003FD5856D
MVRILSNGDIVPDDDPRAQGSRSRGSQGDNTNRPRQGFVQHADYNENQGMPMGGGQQVSVFETLNQKLLGLGIPRFNIGQFTIEPIVSLGFLLAGVFLGLPGLIFAGLLFVVSKMSQTGGNPFTGGWGQQGAAGGQQPPAGGGGGGGGGFGGGGGGFGGGSGGHRLGRS